MSFDLFSQISEIQWPQVPNPWAGGVLSILYQLEQTQWWPPDDLRDQQLRQASLALSHAYSTTPFYRNLYDQACIRPEQIKNWDDWRRLPIVDRKALQDAGTAWHSENPPKDHGGLFQHFTSGSTGRPLRSVGTALTHLFKIALILRQHRWAGRDTRQKIVFIQEMDGNAPPEGRRSSNWEKATEHIIKTGSALAISVHRSVAEQIALIRDFEPAYLITYPSVIDALARYCLERNMSLPFLRQIGSYGEILAPACRAIASEAWNVRVTDIYSAKEIGPVALQCPQREHYHVQSEAVIVEILDAKGRECAPGETGRLVLTSLHNFAAPMLRYEIGDYAEQGETCECGRTLPVIKRILGRQRNMLKYPDGSERWPSLSEKGLVSSAAIPQVQQFQLVQHSVERIEARLVVQRAFTPNEETMVADYLRSQLGSHWQIDFSYPAVIERSPGGKFEDFVSLCA